LFPLQEERDRQGEIDDYSHRVSGRAVGRQETERILQRRKYGRRRGFSSSSHTITVERLSFLPLPPLAGDQRRRLLHVGVELDQVRHGLQLFETQTAREQVGLDHPQPDGNRERVLQRDRKQYS